MPIHARIDHVAIAVPSWEAAETRWREQLGGGVVGYGKTPAFWSRQLRFANGAKLELLAPPRDAGPDNFVRRFLDRFGAQIHHITLKVPNLPEALDALTAADMEPVDVRMDDSHWHEAFLRPSQAGGLVVQIAWAGHSDEQWARMVGHEPQAPRADAPALLGPLLTHPDLDVAAALWTVLGASTLLQERTLVASWPDSVLTVRIEEGPEPGPVALLGSGAGHLPAHPEQGPELRVC